LNLGKGSRHGLRPGHDILIRRRLAAGKTSRSEFVHATLSVSDAAPCTPSLDQIVYQAPRVVTPWLLSRISRINVARFG